MSLSKLQGTVKNREAWHAAVHGVTESQTWLSNWTAKRIIMSGQFIFLPQFLPPHNKNLEWWIKVFKIGKLQLSLAQADSKVFKIGKLQLSLAQADRNFTRQTLPKYESRPTLKEACFRLLASPTLYFQSPPCAMQNRAYTHHWSMKGNANGIHLRLIDICKLYNSRLCLCLSIIQSVIIRCRIFINP